MQNWDEDDGFYPRVEEYQSGCALIVSVVSVMLGLFGLVITAVIFAVMAVLS